MPNTLIRLILRLHRAFILRRLSRHLRLALNLKIMNQQVVNLQVRSRTPAMPGNFRLTTQLPQPNTATRAIPVYQGVAVLHNLRPPTASARVHTTTRRCIHGINKMNGPATHARITFRATISRITQTATRLLTRLPPHGRPPASRPPLQQLSTPN